jgi:hypothetical protein
MLVSKKLFYFILCAEEHFVCAVAIFSKIIFFENFFFAFRVNRPRRKRFRQKKMGSNAAWVS